MATTYVTRWEYSIKEEIIALVEIAMVKAAIAIQSEDAETANHANRSEFARQVLRNPLHMSRIMTVGVVTQLSTPTPTDEALDAIMASIWNAYAGVV